jgi:hypothetical protein
MAAAVEERTLRDCGHGMVGGKAGGRAGGGGQLMPRLRTVLSRQTRARHVAKPIPRATRKAGGCKQSRGEGAAQPRLVKALAEVTALAAA